jgi:class 3 adenylate cyclase
MTETQKKEIANLVNDSLDQAEEVWGEVGPKLLNRAMAKAAQFANEAVEASVPTTIPGHEFLEDGKPIVDEFIALVLDMRDSSKHLNCACAHAKVEMLQRVFYETAAILPACSKVISDEKGGVTEYLGDGLLAFFQAEKDRTNACYSAHNAASGCMAAISEIINPILDNRYDLPEIEIGIGMSFSKAVLTIAGQANFVKPVAFGQCVFHATKLSKGRGEIVVDEALNLIWPTSDTGTLRFFAREMNGIKGYVLQNKK